MWVTAVLLGLALAYVGYRLSLTVRAVRADRAGDGERADAYRLRGSLLYLGLTTGMTLLVLIAVAVMLAVR